MTSEARPDLVLMDIALGRDGRLGSDASHSVEDPAVASTPIIALTAHALESDRRRSVEVGCRDFDTKPIDLARLIGKIERQLSAARHAAAA